MVFRIGSIMMLSVGQLPSITHRDASRAEIILLCIVMFSLPLFEAPKNIAIVLFCGFWIANAFRCNSWGQGSLFTLPILCLAGVLWVGPVVTNLPENVGVLDSAPRWSLLAIFVILCSRLNYTQRQVRSIWISLLVGGIVAIFDSLWVWYDLNLQYPEFRSVGHVNHSAMYAMVVFAAALPALASHSITQRTAALCALAAILVYIPLTKSGVMLLTTIATSASFLFIVLAVRYKYWVALVVGCLAIGLLFAAAAIFGGGLWEEFSARVLSDNPTNGRWQYIQIALEVYDRSPIFGSGWSSFKFATSVPVLAEEVSISGHMVDFTYAGHPHGHNLFATILVERGVLGVVSIYTLIFLYFIFFLPTCLSAVSVDSFERFASIAGFLIALTFFVAGFGNTTMMNEHGTAGMALISVVHRYTKSKLTSYNIFSYDK